MKPVILALGFLLVGCASSEKKELSRGEAEYRYQKDVKQILEKSWKEEMLAELAGKKYEENQKAWLTFRVAADGRADKVEFKRRAEIKSLNQVIERSVLRSSPLPPPPPAILENGYYSYYWEVGVEAEAEKKK